MTRRSFCILILLTFVAAVTLSITSTYFLEQGINRHESCLSRERLYDGEVFLTNFFAGEVHATAAQTEHALRDLRIKLGTRPHCG